MPIISKAQEAKEKKRKINAKRFALISIMGLSVSFVLFFFTNKELGIFAAIISSSLSSLANLVDD